jgi:poly-beta-1,6-N-acetyl-D-glucosamine synthase
MSRLPTYVLITPARNEAAFIELTLKSVVSQTVLPLKWVIVSDGSTDGTDDIVQRYARQYPWIELLRMPERSERHFAGKVHAFNAGYDKVKGLSFEVVVSLDADISFDKDYFAYLLQQLRNDPPLGLVGTPFRETSNQSYNYRFTSIEHVSGACQVFRRECFEDIGGYVPVKKGIDHIAVVTARMKGWKTRTFRERECFHHRAMGTAQAGKLAAKFRIGENDYTIGNHPLWELFRTVYQTTKKPYFFGGAAILFGYVSAAVRHEPRPVSPDLVRFCRREQIQRLACLLNKQRASRGDSTTPAIVAN